MATYRHDPDGAWFAAVRGGTILLVPAVATGALPAIWPALAEGDPTPQVLDRLTAQGVAATPSFALVVRDHRAGSARVVVRGPITVRAGDVELHGAGVSTWVERVVDGANEVQVEVDGADVTAGEALPVVEAVVAAIAVASAGVETVAAAEAAVGATAAPVVGAAPVTNPVLPATPATGVRAPMAPPPPSPVVAAPATGPTRASVEQTIVPAEETVASVASPARSSTPIPPVTPIPPGPSVPPVPPVAADLASTVTSTGDLDGDHDGMTVASIDIRRLREARAARTATPTPANGTPLASAAGPISIRLPDGSLEPIAQEVVLGRAPSVSKVSGGRIPRLVTIGLGDPDISRSHVRLALEGDTVVVTDLHSRNGTHVAQPGKTPVKLRAGEPTPVLAGTVVDFGGGWTIQVVAD